MSGACSSSMFRDWLCRVPINFICECKALRDYAASATCRPQPTNEMYSHHISGVARAEQSLSIAIGHTADSFQHSLALLCFLHSLLAWKHWECQRALPNTPPKAYLGAHRPALCTRLSLIEPVEVGNA